MFFFSKRQIYVQFIKMFDESYVPEDQLNVNLSYNNKNFNLNVVSLQTLIF